ncbi:ATP-binding protein [Marinospirillum perlucidum]|uniref:ATP-binding protein n=1 Tax=Marinospirillum perlucidum TaxID=1982602 RepID=UPI000DF27EE2|nr:ATP-binding protein [Marinospirillum perlucidum]
MSSAIQPSLLASRFWLKPRIIWLVLLLVYLIMGLVQVFEYRQSEAQARTEVRNLTGLLDAHLHADLMRVSNLLHYAADKVQDEESLREMDLQSYRQLQTSLARLVASFPLVDYLNIFDHQGRLYVSSLAPRQRPTSMSIADRPHFHRVQEKDDEHLAFSGVIRSRANGEQILVISHRLEDGEGRFLGSINAPLNLGRIQNILADIEVGEGGVSLLRRSDSSILLARYPVFDRTDFNRPLPEDNPIRQRITQGQTRGSLEYTASTDGVERLGYFQVMEDFPFYTQVSLARSHYMASWYDQTWIFIWLALLLFSAGFLVTHLMRKNLAAVNSYQLQLEEERQRLSNIVWGTGVGTWEWNLQTGETRFNQRWAEMAGYTLEELQPVNIHTWERLAHPRDLEKSGQALEAHFSGKKDYYEARCRMLHKDGHWIWVLDRGRVVSRTPEGEPEWIAGTHLDITAQQEAFLALEANSQELEASNNELEHFAYAASHDLRQPLRMVNSYLQLLERGLGEQLDERHQQLLEFARGGATRLDQMLLSLLEYSRVGRQGEPQQSLPSRQGIDEALQFLQPDIQRRQAEIEIQSGDWPVILASSNEYTRLWQNLIGNAIKYTPADRTPRIQLAVKPAEGGWLFSIRDNGVGIDPDQMDRLFQVFQRLQSRSDYEGTGVGLAVARKIVERHGGRIWVESEGEGQGSCFYFTWPTDLREDQEC